MRRRRSVAGPAPGGRLPGSDPHGEQHEGRPPTGGSTTSRSEPRSLRYHDLAGARPLPAGRVLAIGAVALVLAALLNADGLSDLANRQPVGWKRNVANAAVGPFCVLGDVTRLKDARAVIRRAADKESQDCRDSRSGSDAFVAPPTTTAPPTGTTAPPVTPRTPTAEDPLRIWLGGDSMTIELAQAVEEAATGRADLDLTTDPRVNSGLTRPDYFDWPRHLADEVLPAEPDVVVVMFGANDSQGLEVEGTPYEPTSPQWREEYRRRVGIVMDQLRGDGRLVVWVGQPRMRDDGFDARMQDLDEIFAGEAEDRPWVRFLDSRPVLSPDSGEYQATADGVSLRQDDGVHLDLAGAALLAEAVLAAVAEGIIAAAGTEDSPPR